MIPGTFILTKWVPDSHEFAAERSFQTRPQMILQAEDLAPREEGNYGVRTRILTPEGPILVTETIAEINQKAAEAIEASRQFTREMQEMINGNGNDHGPPTGEVHSEG